LEKRDFLWAFTGGEDFKEAAKTGAADPAFDELLNILKARIMKFKRIEISASEFMINEDATFDFTTENGEVADFVSFMLQMDSEKRPL